MMCDVKNSTEIDISDPGFKLDSGQLSIAASQNPSVVNTICINSFHY